MNKDSVISDTIVEVDRSLQNEWKFQEFLLDGHCVSVAFNNIKESELCNSEVWTDISLLHLLEFQESLDNVDNIYWEKFCNKTKIKPF